MNRLSGDQTIGTNSDAQQGRNAPGKPLSTCLRLARSWNVPTIIPFSVSGEFAAGLDRLTVKLELADALGGKDFAGILAWASRPASTWEYLATSKPRAC